ncbi:YhbY family RNA-binding protein [Methanoplanus sp. FWC-SCC4]|uniref:YhbY family RNA-binding protein n=1 Tax=Methanochimaera problematica TaxID=2609417 RepID=A0AA97FC20_9EURY|nr:YhbY family RNA-binding protein [Methanoplanus sp. FWC-SCC4]WOF15767.1 YhbY family RNA-binding protein [Methanoplanus sp. FWC-SCC4]
MTDKDLNRKINLLKATLWIGKKGCTDSTIEEIRRQIKDSSIIKVKWLRSTDIDPEQIAALSNAELVQVRGRTMVLRRNKERK